VNDIIVFPFTLFWYLAMDFNNLKKSVANISLYDIKAGVRQLQNGELARVRSDNTSKLLMRDLAVMNYTEMEAKVREATNNEP
jgi:epsin